MGSDQRKLCIGGISWEEKLKEYYGEVVQTENFTVRPWDFGFVVLSELSVLEHSHH